MAACGSLQHIFEKPLPENPTLLESLSSWKHIKSIENSSFTEIFGELHFKENPAESASSSPLPLSSQSSLSSSSSSLLIDLLPPPGNENLNKNKNYSSSNNERNNKIPPPPPNYFPTPQRRQYRHSDSFSSMNSESLLLCTEGLGFESSDDVEDLKNGVNVDWQHHEERTSITKHTHTEYLSGESKRSRISGGEFPPPISSIGSSGKPWVCFKSYRNNDRFILKEIRIPTQEFLHACREDGRLKLQFIQSDDEIPEEDEDEDEEDDEEEEEDGGVKEKREENEEKGNDDHDHDRDKMEEEEKNVYF